MLLDADQLTPDSLSIPQDRANNFWYVRQSARTALVFLHGIFSNSRSCWLSTEGSRGVFWPDLVRTDPRLGSPSIYLAGYYTALDAGDFSVAQCAREVIEALQRPEVDGAPAVLTVPNLVFICHSTGGIVARYMLDRYRDLFRDKAIGLALIASPSLGSVWASVAGLAAKYYNQRLGQQLQWNGDTLEDIHGRFRDLVNRRAEQMPGLFGMEACENRMIFRDRIPAVVRWLLPPRLKVVTTLSAGQYFGEAKVLRGTDHFSSVKPNGLNHPSHEFLVTFHLEFERTSAFQGNASPTHDLVSVESSTETVSRPDESTSDGEGIDEAPWPDLSRNDTSHLYLSAAGSMGAGDFAVIGCVVLDEPKAADDKFSRSVDAWLRDPHVRAIPSLPESIRRRLFISDELDPDVRQRLIDHLSKALFEAYVTYATGGGDERLNARALISSLLFNRIRAIRPRQLIIEVSAELRISLEDVRRLVADSVQEINAQDRALITSPPEVIAGDSSKAGSIMAMLTCHIVRQRLRAPRAVESRAFDYLYPQKLRVLHDASVVSHK